MLDHHNLGLYCCVQLRQNPPDIKVSTQILAICFLQDTASLCLSPSCVLSSPSLFASLTSHFLAEHWKSSPVKNMMENSVFVQKMAKHVRRKIKRI